ncbi:MAG: hypothetical protein QXM89_02260 [Candidatus Bathyarchaeia archaeon]
MVKRVERKGESLYICEECSLAYREETWAEKCEEFCSKYYSCSLEITSHAVRMYDSTNYQ